MLQATCSLLSIWLNHGETAAAKTNEKYHPPPPRKKRRIKKPLTCDDDRETTGGGQIGIISEDIVHHSRAKGEVIIGAVTSHDRQNTIAIGSIGRFKERSLAERVGGGVVGNAHWAGAQGGRTHI